MLPPVAKYSSTLAIGQMTQSPTPRHLVAIVIRPHAAIISPRHSKGWRVIPIAVCPLLRLAFRCGSNTAMLIKPLWPWLVLAVAAVARSAEPAAAANALHAALAKNVAHARDWLDQKDYKSLAQSAGGLLLLAELTKAKSDDPAWQAALANVVAKTTDLQAAARGEEAARCKSAVDALESAVTAAAGIAPTGQPQALARQPAIRPLMLTMDAVQGDAKIALLTGNIDAAKKQAHVLAELAKLVSNSRTTEQWKSLAGDFSTSATAAATSTETSPQAVRQLFRGVSQRCEACHEKSRPPAK